MTKKTLSHNNNYAIAQVIYTYDKLDDAKINMEITRNLWEGIIGKVYILHAYNGKRRYGYRKYIENKLLEIKNRGHFTGASDLINNALVHLTNFTNFKYVIVTAADTWMIKPIKLKAILNQMRSENKVIACSSWLDIETKWLFRTGFSTDFFIFDLDWNRANKFFPIKYDEYIKQFKDTCLFMGVYPYLELAFAYYYLKFFADPLISKGNGKAFTPALNSILRLKEREPIFGRNGIRKMAFPRLGLYTYHEKKHKLKLIKKIFNKLGKFSNDFMQEP